MTGTVTIAHADQLRLANLDWQIPDYPDMRQLRKSKYVVSPESSAGESEGTESGNVHEHDTTNRSKVLIARQKLHERHRIERDTSSDEYPIPLHEIVQRDEKRMRNSEQRENMLTNIANDSSSNPGGHTHNLLTLFR